MTRINAPFSALGARLLGSRAKPGTGWTQRWRAAPWPLAGLDIGPRGLFGVTLELDEAHRVCGIHTRTEPLPDGWGQAEAMGSWDLTVLSEAMGRLLNTPDHPSRPPVPTDLAMGLPSAALACETFRTLGLAHAHARTLPESECWDIALMPDGAQCVSTSRQNLLTLQALAESTGRRLSVLEASAAATQRAMQWRALGAYPPPAEAYTTAMGLALRRGLPWGTGC